MPPISFQKKKSLTSPLFLQKISLDLQISCLYLRVLNFKVRGWRDRGIEEKKERERKVRVRKRDREGKIGLRSTSYQFSLQTVAMNRMDLDKIRKQIWKLIQVCNVVIGAHPHGLPSAAQLGHFQGSGLEVEQLGH